MLEVVGVATVMSASANPAVAIPTITIASATVNPPSVPVTRNSTSTVATSATVMPTLLTRSTANDVRYAACDRNCPRSRCP
ncbi:MAG TPA: hypothetical protein VES42_20960 [Pilimelia sp.]|nr:hypothetical protein [Pilimelia sp.]